jgi:hypothetical protein
MHGNMTLYHGSIYDFAEIDLTRGKPFKDFGKGFYTTQRRDHAASIARRNREIILARVQAAGEKSDVKMLLYTLSERIERTKNRNTATMLLWKRPRMTARICRSRRTFLVDMGKSEAMTLLRFCYG